MNLSKSVAAIVLMFAMCFPAVATNVELGCCPAISEVAFTDVYGNPVATYTDLDDVYVKVVDITHPGDGLLRGAVEIEGRKFNLRPLSGAPNDTFITAAISLASLGIGAGDTITATYTDPVVPIDTSSVMATVIHAEFGVERLVAVPNPFSDEVMFTCEGSGLATIFSVTVYDLSGTPIWHGELSNVSGVGWNGINRDGQGAISGLYIYVIVATDGTNAFTNKGVLVKR